MKRRSFLKGSVATGTLAVAISAGLLKPTQVLAADYPKAAFQTNSVDEALATFFGTSEATESTDIVLKVATQAENGAVVPVEVTAMGASVIAVVVEKNPNPMVMGAHFSAGTNGYLSGRVKMGETSNVIAYAQTEAGLIKATKEVKVTVGGCGG